MSIEKISHKTFQGAASANAAPDMKHLLAEGETGWLSGSPAKSEAGTVALRTGNGFLVVLQEADVVEFGRHGDDHMVRVRAGASVVTRFESVNQLLPKSPGACHCSENTEATASARLNTQSGPPNRPIIGWGCYQCWIEYVGAWCELPGGVVFRCYQPQIRCGNVCPPPISV